MKYAAARRAVWLAITAWAAWASVVQGGTGTSLNLPLGPKPSVSGLRLSVDSHWAQGYGYRPFRIGVRRPPPAQTSRTLTVEIGLSSWNPENEFVTVATDIEIPAGSQGVERTIPAPQLSYLQNFSLRVWEDGVLIEDLSVEGSSLNAGGLYNGDSQGPRVLFATNTPVDISAFDMVPRISGNPNAGGTRIADAMACEYRRPNNLPENWINYSGLDLAFISLDEMRDLASKRPAAWRALREWTRTGGNLCVFGVGTDWHGLEEIEKLVGCPATEKEAAAKKRGWETPSIHVFDSRVVPAMMTRQSGVVVNPTTKQAVKPPKQPVAPKVAPFLWKPAGFGRVVAISAAKPFPGEAATWRWLFESLGPARTEWTVRHGTAPDQDNQSFNDFLIADVGLPPIRTYQVLISLFVVAIGPVNYWILKRKGRLHLFLFTVPAAALITSGGLLAYALVADGLESRLRARSLTHLDQSAGEAVRLARLSYYMGLAPSGGLEFPDDVAIAPLQFTAQDGPLQIHNRRLVWRDGQHLTRGWIRSRMPTQFVTTRADKTNRELAILPTQTAGGATIENRLGVRVDQLLLCDEDGKLHYSEQIAPGEQKTLRWLKTEDQIAAASMELVQALSQDQPAMPGSMIASSSRNIWFFQVGRRSYSPFRGTNIETSDSLLEVELDRVLDNVVSRGLKPRSYVAVVERPEEIATGTDGLNETQSLHVIEGAW